MAESISILISGILQLLGFLAIPFIWWLIAAKKTASFFRWVGLRKPIVEEEKPFFAWILACATLLAALKFITPLFVDASDTAYGLFYGRGFVMLPGAIIFSFLQTGLSEEIFFRGFLAKRLISKLGYKVGNILQASAFGLLHGIMFFNIAGPLAALLFAILTGLIGGLLCHINEKQADGSIVPGWIIHSTVNLIAALMVMF